MSDNPTTGFHILGSFLGGMPTLANGDNRYVRKGEAISVVASDTIPIDIGSWGLHYSTALIDSIAAVAQRKYWRTYFCRVKVSGTINQGWRGFTSDHRLYAAQTRTVVSWKDGIPIMQEFARTASDLPTKFAIDDNNKGHFDYLSVLIRRIGRELVGREHMLCLQTMEVIRCLSDIAITFYTDDRLSEYEAFMQTIEDRMVAIFDAAPELEIP